MSAPALRRWMTYDAVEPIGGMRSDWNAAAISATVMNAAAMVRTGRFSNTFEPRHFMMEYSKDEASAKQSIAVAAPTTPAPEPGRQSWQEQKMIGRMFFALSKAKAEEKKKRKR